MKNKQTYIQIITILLLALWIPTAFYQMMNFAQFKNGLGNQPLSKALIQTLAYAIPLLEVSVVMLLVSARSRWVGFGLSSLLMAAFTGFIGLVWAGAWSRLPCGCGKLIESLTWQQHFWFNLFFLAISIAGLLLYDRKQTTMNDKILITGHRLPVS